MKKSPLTQPIPEKDFTSGQIFDLPETYRSSTGQKELDAQLRELVQTWACADRCNDLVVELLITALLTGRDNPSQANLKLMNRALKEMRAANKIFSEYAGRRKVTVFGSARTPADRAAYQTALQLGRRLAEEDFMVITGAGNGIMGAAQAGGGRENGFGLNISLPFEQQANETIAGDPKLIEFNYFFTRKLSFMKESDAYVLLPGGFGTMDEMFETLTLMQTGKTSIKPIVLLDEPGGTYWKTLIRFLKEHLFRRELISERDFDLFSLTDDLEAAVTEVTGFYRNFHSYRYVGHRLVFRMRSALSPAALAAINEGFADLLDQGTWQQTRALRAEKNEPEIAELPRLVGLAKGSDYGRLRQLIDALNSAETSA
ncbi:MAG: TIGR00730 family Rossman fold protein [Verrucomicrobiota bacterium]